MTRVATTRLIDASATLEAADRALVNLWVNRGLDDAAVARMTHMSEEAIAERRGRIVEQLSAELGLPGDDVRAALTEITHGPAPSNGAALAAGEETAAGDAQAASEGTAAGDAQAASEGTAATDPAPAAVAGVSADADEPQQGTATRRARPLGIALVLAAVAAVIVVVLVTRGSSPHRTLSVGGSASVTTSAQASASSTTASVTTSAAAPGAVGGNPLTALPGGPSGVTGSVSAIPHGKTLTLNLSVSGLQAAQQGHYEVWLYNSLLIAQPIGRLGPGVTHLALRLPRDARRYRWIDISFQPRGDTYHSGESLLRAINPARPPTP